MPASPPLSGAGLNDPADLNDPACLNELARHGELVSVVQAHLMDQHRSPASFAQQIGMEKAALGRWLDGAIQVDSVADMNDLVFAGLLPNAQPGCNRNLQSSNISLNGRALSTKPDKATDLVDVSVSQTHADDVPLTDNGPANRRENCQSTRDLCTPATGRTRSPPASPPRTHGRSRTRSPSRSMHFKRTSKQSSNGPSANQGGRGRTAQLKQNPSSQSPSGMSPGILSPDSSAASPSAVSHRAISQRTTEGTGHRTSHRLRVTSYAAFIRSGPKQTDRGNSRRRDGRSTFSGVGKWNCGDQLSSVQAGDTRGDESNRVRRSEANLCVKTYGPSEPVYANAADNDARECTPDVALKRITCGNKLIVFLLDETKLSKGLLTLIPAVKDLSQYAEGKSHFDVLLGSVQWALSGWSCDKPAALFYSDGQLCNILEFQTQSTVVADLKHGLNRFIWQHCQQENSQGDAHMSKLEVAVAAAKTMVAELEEQQQTGCVTDVAVAPDKEATARASKKVAEENDNAIGLENKLNDEKLILSVSPAEAAECEKQMSELSPVRQKWLLDGAIQQYYFVHDQKDKGVENPVEKLKELKATLNFSTGCRVHVANASQGRDCRLVVLSGHRSQVTLALRAILQSVSNCPIKKWDRSTSELPDAPRQEHGLSDIECTKALENSAEPEGLGSDAMDWFYLDDLQVPQGPFSLRQIRKWYSNQHFCDSTQFKRGLKDEFCSITEHCRIYGSNPFLVSKVDVGCSDLKSFRKTLSSSVKTVLKSAYQSKVIDREVFKMITQSVVEDFATKHQEHVEGRDDIEQFIKTYWNLIKTRTLTKLEEAVAAAKKGATHDHIQKGDHPTDDTRLPDYQAAISANDPTDPVVLGGLNAQPLQLSSQKDSVDLAAGAEMNSEVRTDVVKSDTAQGRGNENTHRDRPIDVLSPIHTRFSHRFKLKRKAYDQQEDSVDLAAGAEMNSEVRTDVVKSDTAQGRSNENTHRDRPIDVLSPIHTRFSHRFKLKRKAYDQQEQNLPARSRLRPETSQIPGEEECRLSQRSASEEDPAEESENSELVQKMIDYVQNILFCFSDHSGAVLLESVGVELIKDPELVQRMRALFGSLITFISKQLKDLTVTKNSDGQIIVKPRSM